MRKITEEAINSFLSSSPYSKSNTQVTVSNCTLTILLLHGNQIAIRIPEIGLTLITNAGWFTNTTKERLNGLPGVKIYQKNYNWYLNDKEWDGRLIVI
jgi:hypothetical protein